MTALKWICGMVAAAFLVDASAADAAPRQAKLEQARTDFEARVRQHAAALTIPGIAYAVVRDGKPVMLGKVETGNGPAIDVTTPLRFASVTKTFTAVLLMRAVQAHKLSLDDSASRWLPEFRERPEITVRQLAAHVSEGLPGTEYVYGTTRFSLLGPLLSKVYGKTSFEEALRREVIEPAGLAWHDSPDLGAHAALVSTVNDVARFAAVLQGSRLISAESFDVMTTPFTSPAGKALPVGVGFFSQDIGGERVAWSFGQDDPDYGSALLLLLPKRKLALVMLANTDELSDPFRLLMGNVRTSPFATAFLDAFAPDLARDIGPRDRGISEVLEELATRNEQAAVDSFTQLAARDPAPRADDFALHFAAGMLTAKVPRDFCEALDTKVVSAHPGNRWALLISGGINTELGKREQAVRRYETLLALPNQETDGLARLFRAWAYSGLAMAVRDVDGARALHYIEEGLATGVTGGTRDSLLEMKESLGTPGAR